MLVAEFLLSASSLMFLDRRRTEAEQSGADLSKSLGTLLTDLNSGETTAQVAILF